MITLAKDIDVELRELELKFKSRCEGSIFRTHQYHTTVNGNAVICEQKRREVKGHLTLVTTWYLNGKRVGFNALVGALNK